MLIGWLPAYLRLALWGLLGAWVSMALFKKTSRQEVIRAVKQEVKSRQAQMADFQGELSELLLITGQTLKLASHRLALALGPALLASLPLIFLLVFLSNQYGYELPAAGENLAAKLIPDSTVFREIQLDLPPGSSQSHNELLISLPADGQETAITELGIQLLSLPLNSATPVIHKRTWWNGLIANPLGYLPNTSQVAALEFDLDRQTILAFGPTWMRGWMFTFFLGLMVFSIFFKFILMIE